MNGESGGVYIATVVSSKLDEQGRISIEIPSLDCSYQALFASALAGKDRGMVFLPDKDDQVVVAFVNGHGNMPVVLGSLWSNVAKPPIDNADGNNHVKLIQTRSGYKIRLSDEQGKEKIEIIDKADNRQLLFDIAKKEVTVTATKINLDGELHVTGTAFFGKDPGFKTIIDRNQIRGGQ